MAKTNNKKTNTKKSTTTSKSTKTIKNTKTSKDTKEKNNTKNKKTKKIDKIDILLLGIMLALGILIIYLIVVLVDKSKQVENKEATIVIPIIELNKSYDLEIEANDLVVGDEYVFKVTNFLDDSVNKREISYNIDIENKSGVNFSMYKNGSTNDIASKEKGFMVTDNKLKAKEKQTDIYVIKLNDKNNINKDSKIILNIIS